MVGREAVEVIPILEALWKKKPTDWENIVISVGSGAETAIAGYVSDDDPAVQRSALDILRRIGTRASLPALKAAREGTTNSDLQLRIDRAADAIAGRG